MALWLWTAWLVPAAAAEIRWLPAGHSMAVEVTGVTAADRADVARLDEADAGWAKVFAVYAEQGAVKTVPPMLGAWSAGTDGRLRFEPRFPLARGVRYRAEFHPATGAPVVAYFDLPVEVKTPSTVVRQIYPSADVLPENLLKFYVHFSAPMSRGGIYSHVQLRDAAGRVIELAFLELDEELWDPTMQRLTLLIDPGRIKRGVKPLVDIGPVFEAGKEYSLAIGADCEDAEGRPLRTGWVKTFRVGPADRTPPDPATWKVIPPGPGSREPLVIRFGESMDQALASRMLRVMEKSGGLVEGEVALGPREERWDFVPHSTWSAGNYRIVIATTIEDLAGNNIGKPFDVDLFEGVQRRIETPTVELAFVVK